MKLLPFATASVVCLFSASNVMAQSFLAPTSSPSVSLYQLEHKPCRQAHSLFAKGAELLYERKYQDGLQLLQRAVSVDPNYWEAENDVGFAYLKLRKIPEAGRAFQRAIEIDPENAVGYTNLGVTAVTSTDFKLAEQCARRALTLNPLLATAQALLGIAEVGQGRWTDEAHRLFVESEESIPEVAKLLQIWPRANQPAPKVIVDLAGLN